MGNAPSAATEQPPFLEQRVELLEKELAQLKELLSAHEALKGSSSANKRKRKQQSLAEEEGKREQAGSSAYEDEGAEREEEEEEEEEEEQVDELVRLESRGKRKKARSEASSQQGEKGPELLPGQKAPNFTGVAFTHGDGEAKWKLGTALRKQQVIVLFFLPNHKEASAQEAKLFSKLLPKFTKAGATVVGVSSVNEVNTEGDLSLPAFLSQNNIRGLPIIRDKEQQVSKLFGVWQPRSSWGKVHMAANRSTFIIDPKGIVRRVFHLRTQKTIDAHPEAVLAAVKELEASDHPHELVELKVGDVAPSFRGISADGKKVKLSDWAGRHLYLYFFTATNSEANERQNTEMSADFIAFQDIDVDIVGVSPRTQEDLQALQVAHDISYTLVSDVDHKIANLYGAWKQLNVYGNKSWGIDRTSFYIDEKGVIRKIFNIAKVEGNASHVLDAIQECKELQQPTYVAELKVGDKAPTFLAKDIHDQSVKLKDFIGTPLVLYFCPKESDTSKAELRELCECSDELSSKGASVVAIVPDSKGLRLAQCPSLIVIPGISLLYICLVLS
ncbi:Peroxiredoxin, variant 4 [Balamuthia mandrillaris]